MLVNVTGTEALAPSRTAPKLMLAGLADSAPCVPEPLRGIVSVGFVAVEAIVTLPDAAPVVVGANVDMKVAVAPAAIFWPAVNPVLLKPAPVVLTWLMVMVVFPEFVSVNVCWLELFTITLLKLKLPGFTDSVLPVATALPVSVSV